jgi:murein DD-endopeptidase MepM/ murein hydrolase activator NlpD
VTSGYGWRQDPIDGGRRFHRGLDIALPIGHAVPAAQDGRVTFAGELSGYGLTVVVEHADGRATRYAHLSGIDVQVGQEVGAGDVIARSGASGRATGPHLHVEVIDGGKAVNPAEILGNYVQAAPTGR